jgi:hypothetical protein
MSIMPNLVKKVLVISILYVSVIIPNYCFAVEGIAFGTGDQSSASWLFVNELSLDWQNINLGENTKLIPRYFKTDDEKFNALEYRQVRYVVAPLNSISTKDLKKKHLRIVSTLWNVYLVPLIFRDSDAFKELDYYNNWFAIKGSRIIPFAYADKITVFKEQYSEDLEVNINTDQSEAEFSEPIIFEEWIAQSEQPEIQPDNSLKIQLLDPAFLIDPNFLEENDLLFFEMTGSLDNLITTLNYTVEIRTLEQNFLDQLLEKIFWLEPFILNVKNSPKVKTVGMTMALFTHEAESNIAVRQILDLLMTPKKIYFPAGYIFKNIKTYNSQKIPADILHDASLSRFKKEN